jgi:hypothetical protein
MDLELLRSIRNTHLHDFFSLPDGGAPHAILRPRQKRQASGGFDCTILFTRPFIGGALRRMGDEE